MDTNLNNEVIVMDADTLLVPDKLHPLQVSVNRPAIHQTGFDDNYEYQQQSPTSCWQDFKDTLSYECSKERLWRGCKARLPCVQWMKNYSIKENLVGDIVSGITVGIMQIPLGMAYALLAGCPPATGLYTSFFAVIIYCLLGTSKHVSHGTFAVISLMFAKTVQMYSAPSAVTSGNAIVDLLNSTMGSGLSRNTEQLESLAAVFPGGLSAPMEGIANGTATATVAVGGTPAYTPIQVASAIAMMVGLFQIVFGFLRLGALNVYMSDTLVSGFTTGAAVLVLTSQINSFFEIKTPQYSWPFEIVSKYIYIFSHLHISNVPTIIVSVISLVVLAVVSEFINPPFQKRFKVPIPIELIAVVVGTGVSYALDFSGHYKISIVGFIPSGLPMPSVPPIGPLARNLIGDAFAVAIVSYVIQLSLAKIFAKKYSYEINANQEFIAIGAGNLFSSFFSCFPMSVALSRSMVHDSVGGKTQLAGLISCGVVLVVLLAIAPLFQTLPNCVLAAIIVVAIRRMFLQFRDLIKAWSVSSFEGMTWAVTFLSVSFINIDVGLGIGVFFSILTIVWRSQRPHTALLGLVPDTGLYKDIHRYPKAKEEPGIKIYEFAAPIIFANVKTFRKQMYHLTGVNPRVVLKKLMKQKRREEMEIKKRVKRRGSLIPPNPSSESLDILVSKSKVDEQLPDGTVVPPSKGHCNRAFESDNPEVPDQMGENESVSSGLGTMNDSVVTLNIVNLQKGQTNNGDSCNGSGTNSVEFGYPTSVSTVSQELNSCYSPTSLHHIIIDLSCASFIDSSGVQVLSQVIEEYKRISIAVYIASCPVPIIDMLELSDFYSLVPRSIVFPTVNDAVLHAIYNHPLRSKWPNLGKVRVVP